MSGAADSNFAQKRVLNTVLDKVLIACKLVLIACRKLVALARGGYDTSSALILAITIVQSMH